MTDHAALKPHIDTRTMMPNHAASGAANPQMS